MKEMGNGPTTLNQNTDSNDMVNEYVRRVSTEAAIILFKAPQTAMKSLIKSVFPTSAALAGYIQGGISAHRNVFHQYKFSGADIARGFTNYRKDRVGDVPFSGHDQSFPSGAILLLKILDGRDKEAPIRVGLWYTSPDNTLAILQHYHPEGTLNQGRLMDNCMQGAPSRFDRGHLEKMLAATRHYDALNGLQRETPLKYLMTINRTDPLKPEPDRYLDSEPILMIEYDPQTRIVDQLRGYNNEKIAHRALSNSGAPVGFPKLPPEAIGHCVKALFKLDPFLKLDKNVFEKDLEGFDRVCLVSGQYTSFKHVKTRHLTAFDSPDEILSGGKFSVDNKTEPRELFFVSRVYGATLDMSRATPEQKALLTIVRGDIRDDLYDAVYPNLIQFRELSLRAPQALQEVVPALAKERARSVDVETPSNLFRGKDLIPLPLAIERDTKLDSALS